MVSTWSRALTPLSGIFSLVRCACCALFRAPYASLTAPPLGPLVAGCPVLLNPTKKGRLLPPCLRLIAAARGGGRLWRHPLRPGDRHHPPGGPRLSGLLGGRPGRPEPAEEPAGSGVALRVVALCQGGAHHPQDALWSHHPVGCERCGTSLQEQSWGRACSLAGVHADCVRALGRA